MVRGTLGKHFLPPVGCGSIFPAKHCQDAWRSGSVLPRNQVNMLDKAKLCSPIHSTFEVLVVRHVLRHCRGELGSFLLTNASGGHCSFQCISVICWAYFSDVVVSLGFRKLQRNRPAQITKQWPWPFFFFFLVQIRLSVQFSHSVTSNSLQPHGL